MAALVVDGCKATAANSVAAASLRLVMGFWLGLEAAFIIITIGMGLLEVMRPLLDLDMVADSAVLCSIGMGCCLIAPAVAKALVSGTHMMSMQAMDDRNRHNADEPFAFFMVRVY
jgi:hypothetical protein